MKQIIAAALLAVTSIAAMGQTHDQSVVAQQHRQQANAGANEGKKAYNSAGIYGVAKAAGDCMEGLKAGRDSAYKCMGIEVVGLVMKDKTPVNANTQTGLDWFESKNITNRVYAYCFMFLGIKSDMACGLAFATAKMASDSVVTSMTSTYKGDTSGQAPSAAQPSFDCAKASTRVERLICTDEGLARLDVKLLEIYNLAKDEHPRSHDGDTGKSSFPLGADQTRWRTKVRDACKDVACLKAAYENRAIEIKQKFPY